MPRLIDADELTAQIMGMAMDKAVVYGNAAIKGSKEIFALAMVTQAPTIDAEPVRHGKWILGKCNRCGEHAPFWSMATTYYESNFCPHCGARMDAE